MYIAQGVNTKVTGTHAIGVRALHANQTFSRNVMSMRHNVRYKNVYARNMKNVIACAHPSDVSTGGEAVLPIAPKKQRDYTEMAYMTGRAKLVNQHFPNAIGIDDFLHRLEIALYAYGFSGDNAIGMCPVNGESVLLSEAVVIHVYVFVVMQPWSICAEMKLR